MWRSVLKTRMPETQPRSCVPRRFAGCRSLIGNGGSSGCSRSMISTGAYQTTCSPRRYRRLLMHIITGARLRPRKAWRTCGKWRLLMRKSPFHVTASGETSAEPRNPAMNATPAQQPVVPGSQTLSVEAPRASTSHAEQPSAGPSWADLDRFVHASEGRDAHRPVSGGSGAHLCGVAGPFGECSVQVTAQPTPAVRGAKAWVTTHFSLAPARWGTILCGRATATVLRRSEPSRA